ncbi:MAG: GspH/FimT family pseudopilin [Sedimentisphaerales bacterium]|nr:GspH/FimT family pseudopilin [Sedimentisphaerales bacterium]
MKKEQIQKNGFTLVEILIVVAILAIAMAMAVPMFSGAADFQLQSGANMIAADLEYAKSMAISTQQQHGVIFDTGAETYSVVNSSDTPLSHPVKKGFPYTIDFSADSRLNRVDLKTAPSKIYFDSMGNPLDASFAAMTVAATITLEQKGGGSTMTITIEPVTGYIRIQ